MAQIPTLNGSTGIVHGGYGSISSGSIGSISTSNATYNPQSIVSGNTYTISLKNDCPDLPPLVIPTYDEFGKSVTLTLSPEPGISVNELTKIMMMCLAVNLNPSSFNALAHVKKNNLERHFTYS